MKRSLLVMSAFLALVLVLSPALPSVSADDPMDTVISGNVVYSPSGIQIPFANATVAAINSTNSTDVYQTLTDENGSYSLSVPNGTYDITAYSEGYESSNPYPGLVVSGNGTIYLDNISNRRALILVPVYGTMTGTIRSEGDPVEGATVTFLEGETVLNSTVTGADGFYSMIVQSGSRTMSVTADGYSAYSEDLDVNTSQTVTADVDMTPLSSYGLYGYVVTTQGGLEGATVTLHRVNSTVTFSAASNGTGAFGFDAVLEGEYSMVVTRDGYIEFQNVYGNLTVLNNTVLEYPVVMREAYGSLNGFVYNGTFMISDALITLYDSNGDFYDKIRTDREGYYAFDSVPTGTYTVTVERNGYEDMNVTVLISASQSSTQDFDMLYIEVTYLFGLDLPHSLMLIGVFLAGCIVIIAIGFRMQVGETPEMLYLKVLEEDDEEKKD